MEEHSDEYLELLEPENEAARTALKEEYETYKATQVTSLRLGQRTKAQLLSVAVKNLEAQVSTRFFTKLIY